MTAAEGPSDVKNGFAEIYFAAKEAILFYETRERKKAIGAIIDLRDALDHLMLAEIAEAERQRDSHLVSAKEHLRRAAIEPLEEAVENRLVAVIQKYRWRLFAALLFLPRPDEEQVGFFLKSVQHSLQEGRLSKNAEQWNAALKHFKEGYQYCEELDRILPDRALYWARIFSVLLMAIGALIGALIRHLLGR